MATRVVLKKVRLSFPELFEPKAFKDNPPKYSTMVMFPKSDKSTLKALREAEKEAAENGKSKFGGKIPGNLASIIHDGDDEDVAEDYPERKGHWYMTVSSSQKYKPGVVDKHNVQVMDQSEVYSGVFANVSVTAFPFNQLGNKGISFGLNNVQVLGYGDNLAGGVAAEDEFDAEEVEEDDDLI